MRADILVAIVLISSTVVAVRLLDHTVDQRDRAAPEAEVMAPQGAYELSTPQLRADHEVRIAAAHDHQFYITAGVNRRAAQFLVDTGASYVALRESDARAAGIFTVPADYTILVRTANGETMAALVTIDEIEIEDLQIREVKALVLPDEQLGVNLLGMSFLSRLESVEARAGELVLRG